MGKSYNQRNAKVDTNQPKIVEALRRVGAKVKPVHTVKGFCDIIVGYNGKLFMMEIKNDEYLPAIYFNKETEEEKRTRLEKLLSEDEKSCMDLFQSAGVKYHIVATIDEAIKVISE